MLESVDLLEFEVIVAPKLRVASPQRVGGLQQAITKVRVSENGKKILMENADKSKSALISIISHIALGATI